MIYTPQPTRPGGGCAATWPYNTLYSTISRQTVKTRISCGLKRFLRTTGQKNSHDVRGKRFSTHAETGRELFHIQNTKQAPAGVVPLEVRCAHPVRLSPDTHSQGHGRPCLQRHHPRRGSPPHGISSLFIPDGFFRWAFQVCAIPEYLSRIPFPNTITRAFPECSFQIVIPEELSRWLFHDTWFHVLNFRTSWQGDIWLYS